MHQLPYHWDTIANTIFAYSPTIAPVAHVATIAMEKSQAAWEASKDCDPFSERERNEKFEPLTAIVPDQVDRYGWHIPLCARPETVAWLKSSSPMVLLDTTVVDNFHSWCSNVADDEDVAPRQAMQESDIIVTSVSTNTANGFPLSQASNDEESCIRTPVELTFGPALEATYEHVYRSQVACRRARCARPITHRAMDAALSASSPVLAISTHVTQAMKVQQMRASKYSPPVFVPDARRDKRQNATSDAPSAILVDSPSVASSPSASSSSSSSASVVKGEAPTIDDTDSDDDDWSAPRPTRSVFRLARDAYHILGNVTSGTDADASMFDIPRMKSETSMDGEPSMPTMSGKPRTPSPMYAELCTSAEVDESARQDVRPDPYHASIEHLLEKEAMHLIPPSVWYRLATKVAFDMLPLERRKRIVDDTHALIESELRVPSDSCHREGDGSKLLPAWDAAKPLWLTHPLEVQNVVKLETDAGGCITRKIVAEPIDADAARLFRIELDAITREMAVGLEVAAAEEHSVVTTYTRHDSTVEEFADELNDAIADRTMTHRDIAALVASMEDVGESAEQLHGIEKVSYLMSRFDANDPMMVTPSKSIDEDHAMYQCGLLGRMVSDERMELLTTAQHRVHFDSLLRAVVEHTPTRIVQTVLRELESHWDRHAHTCTVIAHAVPPTTLMHAWVDEGEADPHTRSHPDHENELTMEHVIAIQLHHGMRHDRCFDESEEAVPFRVDTIVDRYVRTRYRGRREMPSVALDEIAILTSSFSKDTMFTLLHEAALFRVGNWTARLRDVIASFPSILTYTRREFELNSINELYVNGQSLAMVERRFGTKKADEFRLALTSQAAKGQYHAIDAGQYRSANDGPNHSVGFIAFDSPIVPMTVTDQALASAAAAAATAHRELGSMDPTPNLVNMCNQRDRWFGMTFTMASVQLTGLSSIYRPTRETRGHEGGTGTRVAIPLDVAASAAEAIRFVSTIHPMYHDFATVDGVTGRTLIMMLVDIGALAYAIRCLDHIMVTHGDVRLRYAASLTVCDKSGTNVADAIHAAYHAAMSDFGTPARVWTSARGGYFDASSTNSELHAQLFGLIATYGLHFTDIGMRRVTTCRACATHLASGAQSSAVHDLGMPLLEPIDGTAVAAATASAAPSPSKPKKLDNTPLDSIRMQLRSPAAIFKSNGSWLCAGVILRTIMAVDPRPRTKVASDGLTLVEAVALCIEHAMLDTAVRSLRTYLDLLRLLFISCGVNISLSKHKISCIMKLTRYVHQSAHIDFKESLRPGVPLHEGGVYTYTADATVSTVGMFRIWMASTHFTSSIATIDRLLAADDSEPLVENLTIFDVDKAFATSLPFEASSGAEAIAVDQRRRDVFEAYHWMVNSHLSLVDAKVEPSRVIAVNAAKYDEYTRALAEDRSKAATSHGTKRKLGVAALTTSRTDEYESDDHRDAAAASSSPVKKARMFPERHARDESTRIDVDASVCDGDASPPLSDHRFVDDEAVEERATTKGKAPKASAAAAASSASSSSSNNSSSLRIPHMAMRTYITQQRPDFSDADIKCAMKSRDMHELVTFMSALRPPTNDHELENATDRDSECELE